MNCRDFEIIAAALARSQVHHLSAESAAVSNEYLRALSHADDCELCSLRLQNERGLSRSLEALATETSRQEPSDRIEPELLQIYRERFSSTGSSQTIPFETSVHAIGRGGYWLAAAAAVVLIVSGVALLRSRSTSQQSMPLSVGNAAPKSIATPTAATPTAIATLKKNDKVQPAPSQRRQHRLTLRDRTDKASLKVQPSVVHQPEVQSETAQRETEIATQFIALGVLRPASLQDGGQIVRVELSRSAMASFGLPVNMDRFSERVKADVLVGADGFAQAIRFVQ